jgi:hypothetical protein
MVETTHGDSKYPSNELGSGGLGVEVVAGATSGESEGFPGLGLAGLASSATLGAVKIGVVGSGELD